MQSNVTHMSCSRNARRDAANLEQPISKAYLCCVALPKFASCASFCDSLQYCFELLLHRIAETRHKNYSTPREKRKEKERKADDYD